MSAPALRPDSDWLNISGCCDLEELRGRLVLLHFWHPASVECLESLSRLQGLQKRFEDQLLPLSIFAPRYPAHMDRSMALRAIERCHVRHPVMHDPDFRTWHDFEIRAWPTVLLIDTQGEMIWAAEGISEIRKLDEQVELRVADVPPTSGVADAMVPKQRLHGGSELTFPSGLAVAEDRVYVADTGRNRVLEANHSGRVLRVFGAGTPGHWDGTNDNSGFTEPRGLALARGHLYVADTGNDCIRKIDLAGGEVTTLAGRGERGKNMPLEPTPGDQVQMPSPWDVFVYGDDLYAAVAGLNQLWRINPSDGEVCVLSGNGTRAQVDGAGTRAALAMPVAIARIQSRLIVLDAATSSLRAARVNDGHLATLTGGGLWDAGSATGDPHTARMQFPQGVATDPRSADIWIADTLNHRLCRYDARQHSLEQVSLDHQLVEPSALAMSEGKLWVANTGAHEILRVDLEADNRCEVVNVEGVSVVPSGF